MKTPAPKTTATRQRQQAPQEQGPFFRKEGEGAQVVRGAEISTLDAPSGIISSKRDGSLWGSKPFFTPSSLPLGGAGGAIQPKLTIGQPNDKYEREADRMAETVVDRIHRNGTGKETTPSGAGAKSGVQAKPIFESEEEGVQTKCEVCEQEEGVQRKEEEELNNPEEAIQEKAEPAPVDILSQPAVQLQEEEPEEVAIQEEPIQETAELARAEEPVTTEIQPKAERPATSPELVAPTPAVAHDFEPIQKQEKEREAPEPEEELRRKPVFETMTPPPEDGEPSSNGVLMAKSESGELAGTQGLQTRLDASKGSGQPLPADTRTEMESGFGADFSGVRVHTGGQAAEMNQGLHAQAFTHGSDIYFNDGKYDPGSESGKKLLAHELTHTVQQGGSKSVRTENNMTSTGRPMVQGAWYDFAVDAASWVGDQASSAAGAAWEGIKWTGGKIAEGASWAWDQVEYIGENAWECAKATGKSVWKLVTWDFDSISDLIGMPKPTGEGPSLLEGIQFVINHPCLKMIPGYRLLLSAMDKLGPYMKFLKGAWRVMTNPSELFSAIMDSPVLTGMIEGIPEKARAIAKKAITFSEPSSEHLQGIWRHLEPKLVYMANNWKDILKETALDLLWPWPGVWGDLKEIWGYAKSAGSQVWDLDFSGAIDSILAIWRTLNTMLGRLYGWFFLISVIVGAIIGAFFGGAGAIPGAIAGAKFALAVGEVLLLSMVAAETFSIAKAGFDLVFTDQTEEEQEEDYEQIASSGLALAITGVMFALGAIAVRFARGVLSRVRGLFRKKPTKKQQMQIKRAERLRQQKIEEGIKKLDDDIAKGKVKMSKEDLDWLNSDPRHKELAYDVAKKKYEIGEAKAALKAERQSSLEGPVKRSAHEGDDFIDGLGRDWDAKWVDPGKSVNQIVDETIALANTGENILLDLSAVNPAKANQIRMQVAARATGTPGEVVFVPKGMPEGGVIGGVTGEKTSENVP